MGSCLTVSGGVHGKDVLLRRDGFEQIIPLNSGALTAIF